LPLISSLNSWTFSTAVVLFIMGADKFCTSRRATPETVPGAKPRALSRR
jgi:hypothetical protein